MGLPEGTAPAPIGGVIGNYAIERELGRGGMGVVYAAVDQTLGKRVAVKVLLPTISQRDDLVQRFFNEARAASTIRHPGIVEVFHYGTHTDGTAYIVMEYLEGASLAARLKSHGLLSIPSAISIARQTALALAAAHRAGIVHRDLKPDNIFLVPDPEVSGGERVKLLDFGVAKLVDQPSSPSQPVQTITGAILGTPQYMSPEQCEGARVVDHRSDLYALGCTLFQMVTGRLPFVASGMGGMIGAHLYERPPHARDHNPLVSDALDAIIDRLLAKSPDARFSSGEEVATVLADPATGAITQRRSVPEAAMPTVVPEAPVGRDTPTRLGSSGAIVSQPRRRRWWLPVLGLLIAGGAAAAVFAAIKSGRDEPSTQIPVTPGVVAKHDPPAVAPTQHVPPVTKPPASPSDDDRKLAELRSAAIARTWDRIVELIGELEHSTDPKVRDEVESIRKALHPAAIARAVAGIVKMRDNGQCKKAQEQIATSARRWGADPQLEQAAAGCQQGVVARSEGPQRRDPAANVPGGAPVATAGGDDVVGEIRASYLARTYQTTTKLCLQSPPGTVLPQECMIASCKAHERMEITATLFLRTSFAGRPIDRGLNECLSVGYNVTSWLNTGNNRKVLMEKLGLRTQEERQQRPSPRSGDPFSGSGKKAD